MATRRTTRRSVAANGNENDLTSNANSTSNSTANTSIQQAIKTAVKQTAVVQPRVKVGLSTKSANTTVTSTLTSHSQAQAQALALAKKRSAFHDVTNGDKEQSSNSRKSMRTRSSTGGKTDEMDEDTEMRDVKEEEDDEEDDTVVKEEEEREEKKPVIARQVKPLRRTALASTSNNNNATSTHASTSASTSTSNIAQPRRALGVKRANVPTTRILTGGSKIGTKPSSSKLPNTASTQLAIRHRREQAELAAELARKELEDARKEEEEHASKRLKSDYQVDQELEGMERDARAGADGVVEMWDDLDEGDEEDPLMVSSYVVEVYEYLRQLELTTMPDPKYMDNQNEVTWKMRGILIDWLVEIHTKFRLLPETIFLATNIIDRFLSERTVSLVKFQLVGVTALFIAAKYEEVVCPAVANFLYMTDGGYDDDEILRAERYILSMIDFNLSYPNPINFLRRISKADGYDIASRTMAKYLMEISIVDHKFMGVPPSLIAAAGNWLARKVLNKGPWDANLVHYSGYTEEELKPTAQLMLDYIVHSSSLANPSASSVNNRDSNPLHPGASNLSEPEHPNFMKKYAGKKFFKASISVRKWAEEEFAPIEFYDPKSGKIKREIVPAIL